MKFKIVTPEKVVYENEIDQITLTTKMGEVTILPNHIPLVSSLKAGEILIKKDGQEIPLAVSGGFAELANNNLVILADTAERVEEIDEAQAEEARKRAEEFLKRRGQVAEEAVDYTALAAKLEKELARLKVVRKYRRNRPSQPTIRLEE
ncbi:MAG: ATP synthase F1 subunit epsilon [Candidatus Kerfeldbacteria bacterium CG_4_10_14_0_8_um_filter_42_10]|uniref:ATP synthase epsilon chain n=1 Tax=Candidatus Kerfeldbacteria bacterium CG_4_10_14_0_8_um_filter_42_10 TaxID=2014248 RepID=A0A2M7RKB8_9BACT|nr:MAG: ATP synthase F1 subunit epsilon [Candidatus Kerfeldbacteria bacterium CG_4_10_14_0_8_um_filter_42_10]